MFKGISLMIASALLSSAQAAPTLINGAGSTFAAPLYSKWIVEYRSKDPSVEINYQSIGSGGGIRQFIAGTTDFGATDDPMKDNEIKQARNGAIHLPTAIGAVAITYNLKGVNGLRLSPEVIADIYSGKVTKWNDERIKKLNPKENLPNQFIVVCHRADGSGTTAVFTEYLSQVTPDWKSKIGHGKSVKFPTGLGGKGSEGVTGLVKQNPGAIGYVEMTFARVNKLPMAAIRNKSNQFVEPTLESVSAAMKSLKSISADLRLKFLNAPGKEAYPIAAPTYIVVPQEMPAEKGEKIVNFLKWALTDGQKLATELEYGALPAGVAQKALSRLAGIRLK